MQPFDRKKGGVEKFKILSYCNTSCKCEIELKGLMQKASIL